MECQWLRHCFYYYGPVDIIGEKVDHLAHGGLAQSRVGEFQSFSGGQRKVNSKSKAGDQPVKQRTRGNTNLHSQMHDPKEVWVMRECIDCGT